MQRKIQRKPIRQIRDKVVDTQANAKGINIQGIVTVIGGLTGIAVAILWIAGRFYAAGYFGAMNIPAFQINFSVWEYAEVSWLKLIFYFLKRIYPIVVPIAIVPPVIFVLAFIVQKALPKLRLLDATNKLVLGISKVQTAISYTIAFIAIVIFSYILLQVFIDINRSGQLEGKQVVFSNSYGVQIYSKEFLPLGAPKTIPNTTTALLEYDGLRLLTSNNGKYYLFRDIDPATCKPSQVFVITDSPEIVLVLSSVAPIDAPCVTNSPVQ